MKLWQIGPQDFCGLDPGNFSITVVLPLSIGSLFCSCAVHWRLCIDHLSIHAWNRRTRSLFPLPCNNTISTDCHAPLEQNMCTVWDLLIMSSTYSLHQTFPCISTSSLSSSWPLFKFIVVTYICTHSVFTIYYQPYKGKYMTVACFTFNKIIWFEPISQDSMTHIC